MRTESMPVIELNGTPRERGRNYGETVKPQIAEVIENWRGMFGSFSDYIHNTQSDLPINAEQYLKEFFSNTNYVGAIKQWAPELMDEVKGIAEGATQSIENVLGLQMLDEEWMFGLRRGLARPVSKCTAFGVTNKAGGSSYAGQNMDVGSWVEGRQVLLRITPSDSKPQALIFSMAGNIGLNGLNAYGIGITCNTLPQLNYAVDGLPVAFIVRSILTKKNLNEAEAFLRTIKHASGQNYILSASGDMRCFECCGTSVIRYYPENATQRVFHSNHPLVSQDECAELPLEKMHSPNSIARLTSISNRLGNEANTPTIEQIKAALAAHDDPDNPVSRNTNKQGSLIGYTAGSAIYEFDPAPRLHLAAGPPCETDYKVFGFTNELMARSEEVIFND